MFWVPPVACSWVWLIRHREELTLLLGQQDLFTSLGIRGCVGPGLAGHRDASLERIGHRHPLPDIKSSK